MIVVVRVPLDLLQLWAARRKKAHGARDDMRISYFPCLHDKLLVVLVQLIRWDIQFLADFFPQRLGIQVIGHSPYFPQSGQDHNSSWVTGRGWIDIVEQRTGPDFGGRRPIPLRRCTQAPMHAQPAEVLERLQNFSNISLVLLVNDL